MKDSSAVCIMRGHHEWGPDLIRAAFGLHQERCRWCSAVRPALTDRERLRNLADALAEDILAMSDEELLAEAQEAGTDVEAEAAKSRAAFERAVAQIGKRAGGKR